MPPPMRSGITATWAGRRRVLRRLMRLGVRHVDGLDTRWDLRRIAVLLLLGVAGALIAAPPPVSPVVWGTVAAALVMALWQPAGGMGCLGFLLISGLYGCMLARSVPVTLIALVAAIALVVISNLAFRQWRRSMRPQADRAWFAALGWLATRSTPPPSPARPPAPVSDAFQPMRPPDVKPEAARTVEDHLDYMTRFFFRPWTDEHAQILAQGIITSAAWLETAQVTQVRKRRMLEAMRWAIRRVHASGPPFSAAVQAVSRLQMTIDEGLLDPWTDPDEE